MSEKLPAQFQESSSDLETSPPRQDDLEHNIRPRPRRMRPNFFLKAALLTFDDFKERFGRVHADLLANDDAAEGDFHAFRETCSAHETCSRRDDHSSARSKSSVALSTSSASVKRVAWNLSRFPKENFYKDDDQFDVSSEESLENQPKTITQIMSNAYYAGLKDSFTSGAITDPFRNITCADLLRVQPETCCKVGIDGDAKRRRSQYSKNASKLGLKPPITECRIAPACQSIDTARKSMRRSDSVDSVLSFHATRYNTVGYEVCDSDCKLCNTSAVIDFRSGDLKKADSDHVKPNLKSCPQICSETSIIRMCIRAKGSNVTNTILKPRFGVEEESNLDSLDSESIQEESNLERSLHGSHEENELTDITDDTDIQLASKAKNFGFKFEDICDFTDPVNDSSGIDANEMDDLEHIDIGRYSTGAINERKLMIIERSSSLPYEGLSLRSRVPKILKPLEIVVRYFPVPPVNVRYSSSPLDVFRNKPYYESLQNKDQSTDEWYSPEESNLSDPLPTFETESENPHSSFWVEDRNWPHTADALKLSTNGNQDTTDPLVTPESSSHSFVLCRTDSIEHLGNYIPSEVNVKRHRSEPSLGYIRKYKKTFNESVTNFVAAAPSRHIPLKRCGECVEPAQNEVKRENTFLKVLGLPFIIYFGCHLGYPSAFIFFIDMFFGPDFTHLLYITSGLIILFVYKQYMSYCHKRKTNHSQW